MARRTDVTLVIDVESTCWEKNPPAGQMSEIIEIGISPVDMTTLERLEKRSILVKPIQSEISPFCTELTTLAPEDFEDAGSLADAVAILKRDYHSKDRLWASWGDYDRRQFERVCKSFNIGYPFGPTHLNVKSLFSVATGESETGISGAFEKLGWKMEGTHHRGHDDAWNIARVFAHLSQAMRSPTK